MPVLAVDIPSGLQADTRCHVGAGCRAEVTVTFIGRKAGLYTGSGPDYAGETVFADLGVPADVYQRVPAAAQLRPAGRRLEYSPGRGPHCAQGAASAMYWLSVAVRAWRVPCAWREKRRCAAVPAWSVWQHTRRMPPSIADGLPGVDLPCGCEAQELRALIKAASVLLVGPGLGRSVWAQSLLAAVLETSQPLVIDADALNLLARAPAKRPNQVLTPHPGEAARLLQPGYRGHSARSFCRGAGD